MKELFDLDNMPNSASYFWKNWSIGERIVAIAATIAVLGFFVYRLFYRDKEQNATITDGVKKLTKAQKEKEAYEQFIRHALGEKISNQVKEEISKLPDEEENA